MTNLKSELKRIAQHVRKMEKEAVPAVTRREFRDNEVAKLIAARRIDLEGKIKNLTEGRDTFISYYQYSPKDDPESHARRVRLNDEFAALPSKELESMDTTGMSFEAQYSRAASLRKRGMHEAADSAYYQIKRQEGAWKADPIIQGMTKEITKMSLLIPGAQEGTLWIGDDSANIKSDDFADMEGPGTKIVFKDDDGEQYVI